MNKSHWVAIAAGAAFSAAGLLSATAAVAAPNATYTAEFLPLNAASTGAETTGQASLKVVGDQLEIDVSVKGAPANMEHWQHWHGFPDGSHASCATATADANGDGYVDLMETGQMSGTTMVPLIAEPQSMDIPHGVYPTADATGAYDYHVTVPLAALQNAFGKEFPGQQLDLDRRVIYIHGVPADTDLPASVQSLGPIPAQTTLPIACGVIEKVGG